MGSSRALSTTVAVLAPPTCRRPTPERTGAAAVAQSGDDVTRSKWGRRLSYPNRITLDLTADDHHALQGARYADRVPMADRLRALISLWREDPALAEAVSTRAQEQLLSSLRPPGPTEEPADTDGPEAAPAS